MADRLCMGCMEVYEDKYDICPYCGYKEGTPAKEAVHLAPGTVIENKYIVGQSIGNGGFGVTYIGWDAVLNQKIAIKEYLPSEFSTRAMGVSDVTIFTGQKEEQFLSGVNKFVDEARRLAKFKGVLGKIYGGNIMTLDVYKPGVADGIVFAQGPGSQLNQFIAEHYSGDFARLYQGGDWSEEYIIYVSDSRGWTYYRYRDLISYEETTSTTSNVPPEGYECYKSENKDTYGEWSAWSDWGVDPVTASDVCNVEQDASTGTMLYRYQTREKTTVTTYYFRKPVYGEWSGWSDEQYVPSDTRQVEERYEKHLLHPLFGFFA